PGPFPPTGNQIPPNIPSEPLTTAGKGRRTKDIPPTQAKPYHEKEKVEGGATCDSGNEPEEKHTTLATGQPLARRSPQQDKEKAGTPSTPPARPSQLSDFTIPIRTEGPDAPEPSAAPKRGRGRPRKDAPALAYLTNKEKSDYELAQMLRADGKITTPGAPFEESDKTEIDNLIAQGTIQIIKWDTRAHQHLRLWNTRLVREVKGKTTTKPYEKSRLVVQGYGDKEKEKLLTQAPTIQRMSQRLLLALGPTLIGSYGATGELRDITQAYPQAKDKLSRTIIAQLPKEIRGQYPDGSILWIQGPLYGVAESGTYWWKTYYSHHRQALGMVPSSYDPCLLYTTTGPNKFGITGMQTDDTLSFATQAFSQLEERKLHEAKFRAKAKTSLSHGHPLEFNGCKIQLQGENITIEQRDNSHNSNRSIQKPQTRHNSMWPNAHEAHMWLHLPARSRVRPVIAAQANTHPERTSTAEQRLNGKKT
ncbi:hypothetical protein MAPG_05945, partial [Magnaporthiopsis poae ATCC 64411]